MIHGTPTPTLTCTAYAVSRLLGIVSPGCKVDIATPGGMTTLTQKLRQNLEHTVVDESESEYDLYVAVDVGTRSS